STPEDTKNGETDSATANPTASIRVPSRRAVSFPSGREGMFQSFGSAFNQFNEQEPHYVEHEYSRSSGEAVLDPIVEESQDNNRELPSPSTPRTPRPHAMSFSPSVRRFPRSRPPFPGSYSASYSSERIPWNTLRQYNDSLMIGSPQSYYLDDG
ncbi:634_t:CDS:2, partial [Acaulospora morrowiae]